jgi:hypothetical protein
VEAEVEVEEVMVVAAEVAEAVEEVAVAEDMDMEEEGVVGDIMVEVVQRVTV